MDLDPKAFAELRASWAAIEENASKAAEQIIPHAQACARSLDAPKPELLGIYQRATCKTTTHHIEAYRDCAGLIVVLTKPCADGSE